MASYATDRKQRIIEKALGPDWRDKHPGKSIDAVYNLVNGDTRKTLFCKVDPAIKEQLDEMVRYNEVNMAELVERLISEEYVRFTKVRTDQVNMVASQFATG